MKGIFSFRLTWLWAMAIIFASTLLVDAQGTAFTYQGRLSVDGTNVNGVFDFTFSLFDSPTNGNQVGDTITNVLTPVTAGRFTVPLDFGVGAFDGTPLWLQLGVRPGGSNVNFTALNPNQALTATPYALFALSGNASGLTGTVPDSSLSSNVVMLNQGIISGNGSGLTHLNADAAGAANSVLTNLQAGALPITNLTLETINDDYSTATNAALSIHPTFAPTAPGHGMKMMEYFPPYSSSTNWGTWKHTVGAAPNPFNDPAPDITWHRGFNYADDVGSPVCPNDPSWIEAVETRWQNYDDVSQMEYWYGWSTPATADGTNWSNRFMSGQLVWDTTTRAYMQSIFGFSVDNFFVADTKGNQPFTITTAASTNAPGSCVVTIAGQLVVTTNTMNLGGISVVGGSLTIQDTTTNYAQLSENGNGLGGLVIDSGVPQQPLTIAGFTNVLLTSPTIVQDSTHQSALSVPLTVQGWSGQSTNLFEVRDYANNLKAAIDQNGNIIASGIIGISGLVTNNYPAASFTTPFNLNSPHHNGLVQFYSDDNGAVFEDLYGYINIKPNPANGGGLVLWGNKLTFANSNDSLDAYVYYDNSGNLNFGADNPAAFIIQSGGFTNAAIQVPLSVSVSSPSVVPLTVSGANSQTADLQRWMVAGATTARIDNSGSASFNSVNAAGGFSGNGGGVTNLNGGYLQPGTVNSNAFNAATLQLLGGPANLRSGVASIADSAVTVTVVFSSPLPDTNYSVVATPEFNTAGATWWVDAKTTNGFTFNLTGGVAGGGKVSWQAMESQ